MRRTIELRVRARPPATARERVHGQHLVDLLHLMAAVRDEINPALAAANAAGLTYDDLMQLTGMGKTTIQKRVEQGRRA